MVQYYTLEQAAQLLQMTPEKLRDMVRQGKIRAFQDRGTMRFRSQEIDEMARVQGLGSDPGLPLGEVSKPSSSTRRRAQTIAAPPAAESTDNINLGGPDEHAVPLGESPSGRTKNTTGSSAKRKTPSSGKPSKLNPAAKASDSDVRLVPDASSMDFELSADDPPAAKSPVPRPRTSRSAPDPLKSDSDIRIEIPTPGSDSDVKIISPVPGSDSDVKIVGDDSDTDHEAIPLSGQSRSKTPSDSDIRMELSDDRLPVASNPNRPGSEPMVTEEIDLDLEALSQEAAKSKPPSSKRSKTQPSKPPSRPTHLPITSPFELSDDDIPAPATPPGSSKSGQALSDSSSDFEVTLDESSPVGSDPAAPKLSLDDEEVSLGELSGSSGSSGINLEAPVDSGISLEADGSDEMEFELSLDDGTSSAESDVGVGAAELPPGESSEFELSLDEAGIAPGDSDSEFELTLDDSGSSELAVEGTDNESASDSEFELTLDEDGGLGPVDESSDLIVEEEGENLFEETDFDVPALEDESGSEAVALEESSSDFDLAVDESSVELEPSEASGSQVVTMDEEDADEGAETAARSARRREEGEEEGLDLDLEEGEETEPLEDELDEEGMAVARGRAQYVEAAPSEWGVYPALMMLPCVIVLFLVGLMGFELVQGMWGYHKGTRITGLIVHPLTEMIMGEKLPQN